MDLKIVTSDSSEAMIIKDFSKVIWKEEVRQGTMTVSGDMELPVEHIDSLTIDPSTVYFFFGNQMIKIKGNKIKSISHN